MVNPEWLQSILDSFEIRPEPFMEVAVADEIRMARSSHGDLDDASWAAFLAEHSAFMFSERVDEDSLWGTYFAPMLELTTADGRMSANPDIAELSEKTVRHWEERASKTANPVLRARYADCVWDLERAITKGRRQHKYAIIAIESYIEVAKRDGFVAGSSSTPSITALSIMGVQMLARGVRLALSIKGYELAKAAASEMISFCSRHGDSSHAGVWLAPFDNLYGQKDLLTSEQESKIIGDLEKMLLMTTSPGTDFNPFGAESAAGRLRKHYNNAEQTKRLVQAYGTAFESMARNASPLLAMAWMQPVIETYEQVGLKPESERLALAAAEKGKRINDDLKTYSIEVKIDRELIDARTDALLAGEELNLKLFRIAREFTPTAAEVMKSLDMVQESAPLLSLISHNIITAEGQTVARIGPIDEDLEGRSRKQTAEHIGMLQPFLSHALSQLKMRDNPTTTQIVTVLYACPLFSERRRQLITEGISAYLSKDWVKAIHVLVPQIEETLRNLLAGSGIPVTKIDRRNPGVTESKNMGDVLKDDRIRAILGEDRWRYLVVLYIDRRGINLRNDIAHGLVSQEVFNQYTADLVFHSFLSMCTFRNAI